MDINQVTLTHEDGTVTLAGNCGPFRLWYRFPDHLAPLAVRADAFLAAALIPAMAMGEDIHIESDLPVSPKLLQACDTLQSVFVLWGPAFGLVLRRIQITGGRPEPVVSAANPRVSFFSGGVDGTYTFLHHADELDLLLFAKGIDMQLHNDEGYQRALAMNTDYLRHRGKPLIPLETNVRFLGREFGLSWIPCMGGGLASIALAGGFRRCYIAAGLSYGDMIPNGSSFVTDHLWSTEWTEIVHDGAEADRISKIRRIAADPEALAILRVCWQDRGYNCGECEKCLRTMASLRALGIQAPTFPPVTDECVRTRIAALDVFHDDTQAYLTENLTAATAAGDRVLVQALQKVARRAARRRLLRQIDETFLGGRLRAAKQRLRR